MIDIKETPAALSFKVLAAPNASRTLIVGEHDGALKIKIAAPPADGKANRACLKHLAKQLKVPKTSLEIFSGGTSKRKQVVIRFVENDTEQKEKKRVKSILTTY